MKEIDNPSCTLKYLVEVTEVTPITKDSFNSHTVFVEFFCWFMHLNQIFHQISNRFPISCHETITGGRTHHLNTALPHRSYLLTLSPLWWRGRAVLPPTHIRIFLISQKTTKPMALKFLDFQFVSVSYVLLTFRHDFMCR